MKEANMTPPQERLVVATKNVSFQEYDLEGPVQPEIKWLPLNFQRETGQGVYMIRAEPGAKFLAHVHHFFEDFLIMEGDLVDSDGTIYRPGDFVSYKPGTEHHSWTETGCLIMVFEWQPSAR
jgi:anti-sigma factor ChrR (cupin superfamily)